MMQILTIIIKERLNKYMDSNKMVQNDGSSKNQPWLPLFKDLFHIINH
jgi:hypothetical protein